MSAHLMNDLLCVSNAPVSRTNPKARPLSNEKISRTSQKTATRAGYEPYAHDNTKLLSKRLPMQNKPTESYGLGLQVTPLQAGHPAIKSTAFRSPQTHSTQQIPARSKREQMAEIMKQIGRKQSSAVTKLPSIVKPKPESQAHRAERLAKRPPLVNKPSRTLQKPKQGRQENSVLKQQHMTPNSQKNLPQEGSAGSTRFTLDVKQSGLHPNNEFNDDCAPWSDEKAEDKLARLDYNSESTNSISNQHSVTSGESSTKHSLAAMRKHEDGKDNIASHSTSYRNSLNLTENSHTASNVPQSRIFERPETLANQHNHQQDSFTEQTEPDLEESGGFSGFDNDFSIEDYVANQKLQQNNARG